MAEKRFSSALYIDIPAENYYTTADDPNKLGFTQRGGLYKDGKGFTGYAPVISEGKFSGKQKLYINGIAAQGLINDKFYLGGDEQTKEQIQNLPVQTILPVAGELAALGLRTPTGRGSVEGTEAFVRDAAAEAKFYADFRKVMARTSNQAKPAPANAATTGGFGGPGGIAGFVKGSKEYYDYWANASDEAIFRLTGGVNKEGRPASAFGINDVLPPGESKYVDAEYTVVKQGGGGGGTPFGSMSGAGGTGGVGSARDMAYTASDGTRFTDQSAFSNYQKMLSETSAAQQKKLEDRRSAFQILREEFTRYGLGQLVGDIENLLIQGTPPAEYAFQLRQTPTYKQRFAANEQRIKKGLRALDEANYIGLEDQYQDVMRRYGLPESYYSRDEIGTQKGFEKLIAADVSNIELERRIQNTQSRLFDANPEVMAAMRQFYPNVTGGEILAYALDPETAEPLLYRKIAAAEIGGAALQAGLTTGLSRAEELAAAGITKAAAQEQYGKIASGLERGKRLSDIYQQPTYTQEVAEAEAFALPNAEQARRQRRKLGQLETAEFGGTSGVTGGALGRERAGQY
jgi:hypothetical protein